jgi:hypothetical protein
MPPIALPHTFHDGVGEQASGAQVMDNFNAIKAPVEALQNLEGAGVGYSQSVWNDNEERLVSATRPAWVWLSVSAPAASYRIAVTVTGVTIEIQGEKANPATLGPIFVPPNQKIKINGGGSNPRFYQVIL